MQSDNHLKSLASSLGLDLLSGTHIEMFSNKKIIIEGCYGINEYADSLIRLNMPKGQLLIFGHSLEIESMEEKIIIISGKITSVEFGGGII